MKNLLLIISLLALISCSNEVQYEKPYINEFEVIIIDSCEYINTYTTKHLYVTTVLTHKGNCKHCKVK